MNENSFAQIDGGVLFYSLTPWTSRPLLTDLLTAAGLERYAPSRRDPVACLRDALAVCFGQGRRLVRPLAKGAGYAVIAEERGDHENAYRQLCSAAWKNNAVTLNMDMNTAYEAEFANAAAKLDDEFLTQCAYLSAAQVGNMLVAILHDLGGTRLRPQGAVYWLPAAKLETWRQIAGIVEQSGQKGTNKCYLIRHRMDEDAIRAVRDAVVLEIESETAAVAADVATGTLGKRALEYRQDLAIRLRAKIKDYETILGRGLDSLHGQLDQVELAAAQASLILAAAVEEVPA